MNTPRDVTSPANPVVKMIRSLSAKKNREEEGLFIVEGLRHVAEAVAAGWQPRHVAFSDRARQDDGFEALLKSLGKADVMHVTDDILSRMTGRDNAQSLLAVFPQQYAGLDMIAQAPPALWLLLDGIKDPGNLGTILRTADAVGAAGVILAGDVCDPYSPEAVRSTVGSFARIPLIRASHAEILAWKNTWSGRMTGTHLRTDTDYRRGDYSLPLVLAMGSEQSGLSDAVTAACDQLVRIPMAGGTESLNLAVSTGIMLYEICRNRL